MADDRTKRWISIDVAVLMLGRSKTQVRRYMADEGWEQEPGTRPARFNLEHVYRTYRRLNPQSKGTP